jgi:tRNA/rRNA methyltransferase
LSNLIAAMEARLAENGWFNPAPGRSEASHRMLHNTFTRPGFSGAEVQFLRGVVRSLAQSRRPSKEKGPPE